MHTNDRDGIVSEDLGSGSSFDNDNKIIFHSKLDKFDVLLSSYDEYRITALLSRLRHSDDINLGQLHKYLHKGTFLSDGSVYINSMILPRQQVQFESTDIVAFYCYLVREVKLQLEDTIPSEVHALAESFSHRYLGVEDNLFSEQSCSSVVDNLKDTLDLIDKKTSLKDSDYYCFYDAIEYFLYANWENNEDGEIWGLSNFHAIWESACLNYIVENIPGGNILSADNRFIENRFIDKLSRHHKTICHSSLFIMNGKQLIPDIVLSSSFHRLISEELGVCHLYKDNWDDYGYLTTFACHFQGFSRSICITYLYPGLFHSK